MAGALNILSTKPLDEGPRTFVRSCGWTLYEASFITTRGIENTNPLPRIYADTIVVFTSENALTFFPAQQYSSTSAWHLACLEGKTLQKAGNLFPHQQIAVTAKYSSTLAKAIQDHKEYTNAVFFCARDHRPELPILLTQANIPVQVCPVYETIPIAATVPATFDAVLFFSPSGVDSFFSQHTLPEHAVCFAIGHTTADSIQRYTHNPIVTSPDTTQQVLLGCVQSYFDHKHNNE